MIAKDIPLSLYVHWPWCVRKCPYCDFNSHALPTCQTEATRTYMSALIADMKASRTLIENRPLKSIFIGGGTPSLIPPQALETFLNEVAKTYQLDSNIEITMEANPGTIDSEHFQAYRSAGVNRLSMGIQSFSDDKLKRLGRIHNRTQAWQAIEIVHQCFDNFNLDVMYALPSQTLSELEFDLSEALKADSTHLSFYQLTIEPNTIFAKKTPENIPDEDVCAQMQETVVNTLESHGFEHYEISGYAKPGHRCQHNLNYWQFGDYLACGAGAHSKITTKDGKILREVRYAQPDSFMRHALNDSAISQSHLVDREEQAFEFMLNVLRLKEGVSIDTLLERTDLTLKDIENAVKKAQSFKLMPDPLNRIVATETGWNYLSDLQELFL